MKSLCFLKDCDNFNGEFDCILHYSKIQNEAQQKIIMHYKAMRSRLEEILGDNPNYEENTKKKCKNQFDDIYNLIKNRVDGATSIDASDNTTSSLGSRNSSQNTVKRNSGAGKENSPAKKSRKSIRISKESLKDIIIDTKPCIQKRTKQTKLSFFTTSSAKKRRSEDITDDDDMTYCEELERGLLDAKDTTLDKTANETADIFNFGTIEDLKSRKPKEKTSTAVENREELTPQKDLEIKIKTEKEVDKSFKNAPTPLSPDIFLSDVSNSNNSVMFVEPPEKEVISISECSYEPTRDLLQEIQKEIKESRKHKFLNDTDSFLAPPKVPIEERDAYDGECLDCQIFYDNIAEKISLSEANTKINSCPIKCDGWKARCKKLRKDDKSRKNGMVIIKCNSKFARRRKEDSLNETAPGIWDLDVEPRKSKPLFRKKGQNFETPDL